VSEQRRFHASFCSGVLRENEEKMSEISAHMAISLDGYIAHTDGETNWIPKELAKEISAIYRVSETLLAGFNTYNTIFEQCGKWPYKNTYVATHYDCSALNNDDLHFLFDNTIDKIENLKKTESVDITVIGGGTLITSLLNNQLLDELNVYIVPILLGDGIRFLGKTFDVGIKSYISENYKGTTKITYIFE